MQKKVVIFVYKMIIIDDETLVLEYLTEFINNEFPEINVIKSFNISSDAADYLKDNKVDIVLTDIAMPGITGIDIAKMCHFSFPDTVVIFFSAYKEFDYAHSAIAYNVHDYILKPISKTHLIKSLSSVINLLDSRRIEEKTDGFANDEYLLACQTVFCDLICSCINDEDELNIKLSSIGLEPQLSQNAGITINLNINDLKEYLNKTWKYGKTALFDSLLRLVCKETETAFFAPIWYTQNKIEIIGIAKKININHEQILSEFKLEIADKLEKNLKLDIKISITKKFSHLNSFLSENKKPEFDAEITKEFYEYIEKNYKNHITLEDAAKYFNFSRVYFSSYFKKCIGENFSTTLTKIRINKAKELLTNKNTKVSAVMHEVGFNHSTHFYTTFKKIVGCSPAEYQKKFKNN